MRSSNILVRFLVPVLFTACGGSESQTATPETSATADATATATATTAASSSGPSAVVSAAPPAASSSAVAAAPRFDEALGGISEGAADTDVVKAFGKATKMSPPTLEQATGDFASEWTYGPKGITVAMASPKKTGPFHARLVMATGASTLKTNKGIGVGASADDVRKAYGATIDKAASNDGEIVIDANGDDHDGLRFVIDAKTKKVQTIAIGRDGE